VPRPPFDVPRHGRSPCLVRQIKDLDKKLEALKAKFRERATAFRTARADRGQRPPPLDSQEKAREVRPRAKGLVPSRIPSHIALRES
jgi:hypothetical protein